MRGPYARYKELVAKGDLQADAAQDAAARRLNLLHKELARTRKPFLFWRKPKAPKGLYLWGGVGRGKSLLMDLFYNNTPLAKKRRVHFLEFMIETHEEIANWRALPDKARKKHASRDKTADLDDPIPHVAKHIASKAQLLCFDEFQVSDITDAMILGRLFEALFRHEIIVVATSNRPPDDLYKDGINRPLFEPFIDLLKQQLDIFHLQAAQDYRLNQLSANPVYYFPLNKQSRAAMDKAWARVITGAKERPRTLLVRGRELTLKRTARDAARISFQELCANNLGAEDYLSIAANFATVFMDDIPKLSPEKRNEAKRFVTLIDALYEAKTKFVCSADAPIDALYLKGDGAFEFARTASRLKEMQSDAYLAMAHTNK
jgi:cell division protein ZapE